MAGASVPAGDRADALHHQQNQRIEPEEATPCACQAGPQTS